ncbi:MAG: magnesium transporter CorA family protein [bacterium]|nr:magnesium transporter CorA family protein [bacterium]
METLKTETLTWHHFQNPVKADFDFLREKFNFHDLILGELMKPTLRPKVDRYDHYLYLVLHFPIFDEKTRNTTSREIDCIVTPQELITVTYEDIPPLSDFFKKCSLDDHCKELYSSKTPAHLLYYLIRELLHFSMRELDHIQTNITQLEEHIFGGKEREIIHEILVFRRDVLNFRRTLKPQHITINSLAEESGELFGKNIKPFFDELKGEYLKVWDLLENHRETLEALYDTHQSLLNMHQNEIMKNLTVMAFITFPLSLIAVIFGMTTLWTPIVGMKYDFWIIVGGMAILTLIMLMFFKKKKWL